MKLDRNKLEWIIPLLQQVQTGGELRVKSIASVWFVDDSPNFNCDQENYRVLMPWAWALVDAEREGAVIQHASHMSHGKAGGWHNASTGDLNFDSIPEFWRIKPSEPKRTPLNDEEMRLLVGQVAEFRSGNRILITEANSDGERVQIGLNSWTAAELMNCKGLTINGKPAYNVTKD